MPSEKPKALSIYAIQQAVGKYYHVTVEELKGKKRTKGIVVPRQIAMYLSRVMTDNSLPKIGSEFGGKDHTTVIHAHDKIALSVKKTLFCNAKSRRSKQSEKMILSCIVDKPINKTAFTNTLSTGGKLLVLSASFTYPQYEQALLLLLILFNLY